MNPQSGLLNIKASKKFFNELKTTQEPIRIHPKDKEAFSISIDNTENYIFWMIEHGSTEPRDETVYNPGNKTVRINPRTEEELEFMEQFFAFYDYNRQLFFISDLRKRKIFKNILKNLDNKLDVDIKGIYVDEKEFINKLKTLSEIRFIITNDLFSSDSKSSYHLEEMIGGKPEDDVVISIEYKQESIKRFIRYVKNLINEKNAFQIKGLLIRGNDSQGFERLLNQDEFIKKIKLTDIKKENNGKFAFNNILESIRSEIERLSDELVK
ncbi:hypothetical protein [Streptococcus marimammalium]|uniref:hypothetical protein n=1 Tax=Streptococcus marimammalium TaxID=269666 RepID=UPI0003A56C81|nr:hypothetical protein [Streptococcus marimammalium]